MTYDVHNPPIMGCGHAANGVKGRLSDPDAKPCCVICAGIDPRADIIATEPDLTGRQMRCCGDPVPSKSGAAFFEYRGPGSRAATICTCHFAEVAHRPDTIAKSRGRICSTYTPCGGFEFDSFYCGHGGWD